MKRLSVSLLSAAIALATGAACAADAPDIDPRRLSEIVRTLSSDEFEGRGPATAGETRTVDYVVAQMKAAGLSPGGEMKDGARTWTQAVPLLRSEIAGTPSLAVTVDGERRTLTQGEEIAVRAAMDGSKSVSIDGAPLVFVGYGVTAPERNWDDFKGVDLKGKVALVLVNDPDFETGEGDFGGKAMTYYGRWTYKYEEAARQGATGLLVIHETAPASYGWATVKNSNTNTMFDIVRERPGEAHPQLEGWIQRDVAAQLFKDAGLDFEALKKQAQTRDFRPVELEGQTFSAQYDVDAEVITSQNIVGLVEGSERPDETVIYSGHWDHLGVGRPDAEGDTIYNGAVDNATGIAALIEVGRAFAQAPKPERSVVFLAVTAEEKGLLGSEYYAANPLYPLARTAGVLNMDALDPHGPARNFTTSGSARVDLLDRLVDTAKERELAYVTDPKPEAGYFFRSDHFPFAKRGVPAVSFGSGDDKEEGGVAAGEKIDAEYVKERYHQPADEWEPSWTFTGMARDLELLYAVGRDLANSDDWPNWGRDSEFRAARDETAGERD
ncbi:M28 family metallopeptidase [Coralloluteibacterium stylophorae]|uniref:M28 family peptidase n=1 Tax=Coralloluteibacterium stylophorae TaxID=1776034 RepID=A0A8J7VR29_9GAMM|nr:M28 family metallopeptidase [Coralloluteibacterium stylophorae]MBS7456961.1 M28 family peptidase [Coralloluteibacterium stylophorae]